MSVKVKIFYPALQRLVEGTGEVRVEGATVGECLADLVRRYPDGEPLLFDTRGKLLKPVYVFVNRESMYKADLARPVGENDELILAVLATGG
jgi:molybdopterin synthase sulfur carrier subunit